MNQIRDYQICSRCIMDTTDRYIEFDRNGVCNHCLEFDEKVRPRILTREQKEPKLLGLVTEIKMAGKGRKYDCIAGLSGGVDSSYVIYLAKKYGLRTLVVHFDNGWDSELAIKNIEEILKKTGFDYYNYIVDWKEFRDLQLAYFKASVVDIEVPTDMGIFSFLKKSASKYRIKYILFGGNIETENVMGKDWNFPTKSDRSNLLAIHKQFGNVKLKTFPMSNPLGSKYYNGLKGIKQVNILTYAECNYDIIKKILLKEFGWRDYGVKHGESTFTKFYQSYVLPEKFGFDKRRAQLSNMICSGQMSRDEAIRRINKPVYMEGELKTEYEYVLKKWKLTRDEFQEIMARPVKSHYDYPVGKGPETIIGRLILGISVRSLEILIRVKDTPKKIESFIQRILLKEAN